MSNLKSQNSKVIVALDYATQSEVLSLLQQLTPDLCRVKVGKELFTATGPALIEQIHKLGFDVFLDLKFHDIPNTVAKACRAAANLGVWMMNVHALGGKNMMLAAKEAIDKSSNQPLLIGVTILTSMGEQDIHEIGLQGSPHENVLNLMQLVNDSGLDGVVCSAQEVASLKETIDSNFLFVTPGIRMPDDNIQDQKRIMSPDKAIQQGADYLVIGRPVTQAEDPVGKLKIINNLI